MKTLHLLEPCGAATADRLVELADPAVEVDNGISGTRVPCRTEGAGRRLMMGWLPQ